MQHKIWHNRNFKLLFASASLTNLGDGVLAVAVPWLATIITQNPVMIGLVAAMRELPWLLFSLPAGVLTDRFDHRRLLMACDVARLVLVLGLAALAHGASANAANIAVLLALVFSLGTIEVLRDNTAQSFLPALVAKDQLEQANGLLWGAEHAAGHLIGPPLAGVLIGVALVAPFGVQAALLAGAVAIMGRVAVPHAAAHIAPNSRQAFGPALREGLAWLWQHRVLRRLAITLGVYNLIGSIFWAMLVLYGQGVLGLNAAKYGTLLAVAALGGLAGSLFGPALLRRLHMGAGLFIGLAGFIAAAMVLALSDNLVWVGMALLAEAFCNMLWNITTVSYRQRHIPAHLLGRVNAAYRFFGTGPAALGSVLAGLLVAASAAYGPDMALRIPYFCAALGAALILAYAALALRLQ